MYYKVSSFKYFLKLLKPYKVRKGNPKTTEKETEDFFFKAKQICCPKNPDRNGQIFEASCNGEPAKGVAIAIGRISDTIKECQKLNRNLYAILVLSGTYYLRTK